MFARSLEAFIDGLWLNMLLYHRKFSRAEAKAECLAFLATTFPKHFLVGGGGVGLRGRMTRDPRYDVLFEPVAHRTGHRQKQVLPSTALQRHGSELSLEHGGDARC